jgi:small subunit ribosomal protein S6e|mmetsp:Transcript_2598/g.4848  ORF Transcript_2598/g.4848 Transcript_2598/m.4848 type:complete len:290 (-) Transcript_2598:47-916(-)
MKFNVASPACGTQKQFEVEDEKKLARLIDLRISQEFDGELLGENWKGYVLKITGGHDKDGFCMKQGVLVNSRVKLLLKPGTVGLQAHRCRAGSRRRKSIRGAIVGHDISVLNAVIVKEGDEKIEGLTDQTVPRRLAPKRATKIRKLFNLTKEDDVRKYVIRRVLPEKTAGDKTKKERSKAPKIQRLVTPVTKRRTKQKIRKYRLKRDESKAERQAYLQLLSRRKQLRVMRRKAMGARQLKGKRTKELQKVAADALAEKKAAAAAEAAAAAKKAAAKAKPAPKAKAAKKK